jgi:hypothetical protein
MKKTSRRKPAPAGRKPGVSRKPKAKKASTKRKPIMRHDREG